VSIVCSAKSGEENSIEDRFYEDPDLFAFEDISPQAPTQHPDLSRNISNR